MSYRIRLCLTHISTAVVAAYSVWYGLQVRGFSQIAFMILFGGGIAVPSFLAALWLMRGLSQMEAALTNLHEQPGASGITELDQTTERLHSGLQRQRMLARNAVEVIRRLGHPTLAGADGAAPAEAFNLTNALGQLSRASAKSVGSILALRNDIARGVHDIDGAAQQQVRTIEHAINSVELLSRRIDVVGLDAGAANLAAREAAELASTGLEFIRNMIRGMHGIHANVELSEKKVASLGQQTEQISSIVETMGNLSARTDMLALNASIEAVRAGQEGRGFAIVAEEVRKLAESTATASRNISALVEAIQSEAHDTVSAMTEEQNQIQEEIRRVNEASTILESIRRSTSTSVERSGQISEATLEQLQCTQEVVEAMRQLSLNANTLRNSSETIRHKTTDLAEAAQELEDELSPIYHYGDSNRQSIDRRYSRKYDNIEERQREVSEECGELLMVGAGEEARR